MATFGDSCPAALHLQEGALGVAVSLCLTLQQRLDSAEVGASLVFVLDRPGFSWSPPCCWPASPGFSSLSSPPALAVCSWRRLLEAGLPT